MKSKEYKHRAVGILESRLKEDRPRIQIILGPRQVGKSWAIRDVLQGLSTPYVYALADDERPGQSVDWIMRYWHEARDKAQGGKRVVLVLDEIQKIKEWSTEVKRLWDEDTFEKRDICVVLLGSSSLTLQKGLSESLTGRFEIIWLMHWSYMECRDAFGFSLDDYIYFGGYPGGAKFISDQNRWKEYVSHSIIEPVLSKDIPLLTEVRNLTLLRNLFFLACDYASQELAYRKIQGQFTDVKSVITISNYQRMLEQTYLILGLQKWSGKAVLKRNSSPKWLPLNSGLISAVKNYSKDEAKRDTAYWGHLVESSVGAYLVNDGKIHQYEVYYWREDQHEVDFVLRKGDKLIGIEVKTNFEKPERNFQLFSKRFPKARVMLVGHGGIKLEEFFTTPLERYFASMS